MKRPNVIVLVLDALRAHNVSCYGYSGGTTPNLDRFARNATLFRRAYTTSSWTMPTHAFMLSGLYLSQHRLESIDRNRRFNSSIVPLPEALGRVGYDTAGFSNNPLFGPDYYFDFFDEFFYPGMEKKIVGAKTSTESVNRLHNLSKSVRDYRNKVSRPKVMFNDILSWVEARGTSAPFFLMANLINIHYPWAPPPDLLWRQFGLDMRSLNSDILFPKPFQFNSGRREVTDAQRESWLKLYDAAIMHVDRELGNFLERLRRWPGWADTVVVILADHGELLGDHDDIVGHTLSLHDKLLHIPLIIHHPDYPQGVAIEGVVQTLDLYPSVLEWAKVPTEGIPPAQLQRPSFSEAVGDANSKTGYAFAEEDYTDSYDVISGLLGNNPNMPPTKYPRQQIAVHSADFKLVWYDDRPAELFNLRQDPDEKNNVAANDDMQSIVQDLQRELADWRSGLEIFRPEPVDSAETLDDKMQNRLRDLGYVS